MPSDEWVTWSTNFKETNREGEKLNETKNKIKTSVEIKSEEPPFIITLWKCR